MPLPLTAPVAFPLLPIVDGKCGCGRPECARIGKHPAVAWADLAYGDPVPRPVEGAGAGIKTGARPKGSGIFVVDLDGEDAAAAWEALGGYAGLTFTVATPRGLHLYFEHPGFPVRNSVSDLGRGIDIRGDGGFVVAPGSPHRSGGRYEIAIDAPPAPAPGWLLDWLRQRPAAAEVQPQIGDVAGAERDRARELFRKACASYPPSIEGQGGDAALFRVVQHGAWDLALPVEDVLEIVAEVFDPRCVPPWGDELASRVRHKAISAKTKSTRPRAEPVPPELEGVFGSAPAAPLRFDAPTREERTSEDDGPIRWGRWDEPVPPVDWLVEGLIPRATIGAFVAHGSSLKTWTELSLAAAVAQGKAWLGRYATKRGRALVVDYESGLYEMRRRVGMLERAPVDDLGVWPMPSTFIDNPDFWRELLKIPDVALVCIDSLAAGTSPIVDENAREAALPMQLAARYSDASGAAVLFVHHSKKDDGGDARKAVRGSTAIYAALDWGFAFEPVEEAEGLKRMRMTSIKSSMGPKPAPIALELSDEGLRIASDSVQPMRSDASDDDVQARILLALRQHGALPNAEKIARAIGIQKGRVLEEIKAMLVRREIAKVPGKGYAPNTPADLRARVVALVANTARVWRRETEIAIAAGVEAEAIRDLVREGVLFRSAEGRFLIVSRSDEKRDS